MAEGFVVETMIEFLFGVISSEMVLILLLLFKTPLRKLVIMRLDRIKGARGPVVIKTVALTFFVVLMSSARSVIKIRNRGLDDGSLSLTDQVLMANHRLQAFLMGCCLFLVLMIDRLHHYIGELHVQRKNMDAMKRQTQGFENGKDDSAGEIKALEEVTNGLRVRLMQLQSELETKSKEIHAAETNAIALRKQSEGFLLEYDRLLKENQILRNELKSLDQRMSHSDSKKNT